MMETSLAEKLRVLRARKGLSLSEAAGRAGVTRDTLSELERGKRHPYTPTLTKLAEGYGVPVESLLEEPTAPLAQAPAPPDDAVGEERRSAEVAREIEEHNREQIERETRVEGFLAVYRSLIGAMEMLEREESPDTDTVEVLAQIADDMVMHGIGMYKELNPSARDSEEVGLAEYEATLAELVDATVRVVEAQEARAKDEGERGKLVRLRHRVASKRVA